MSATRMGWPTRLALALTALCAAVTALMAALAAPAAAAPDDPAHGEGGTPELRQQLEEASRGFLQAQNVLDVSRKRQGELAARLRDVQAHLDVVAPAAAEIVSAAYRTAGSLQTASVLLSSESPGGFVDRAARLRMVARRNERQLRELVKLRAELAAGKAAIDAEVVKQERQLVVMAKRKQDAERALTAYAGGEPAAGPPPAPPAPPAPPKARPAPPPGPPPAQPAPRRADGSWPPESCRLDDPTTTGCLTPRTLHAMRQAQSAGFTRFAACFRQASFGEHPRGRACDFAAQRNGFGGVATGGDRSYGNNLANYFVNNAGRLGVLYVIWFKEIWLPSSGWRAYRSGRGDPSSDHTNHVHLSMF